ncbi:MAG: hypothetical protein GY716_19730 [bacterium]|nr:hypothetical protein [bacterium]
MRLSAKRVVGVLVLCLAVATGVWAGSNAWVGKDGTRHELHGADYAFIEGGEAFDVSELADGETRVFGSGDRLITAQRDGDTVTLSRERAGDESAIDITCELPDDTCRIATVDDGDEERIALIIQKTRECHGEDCEMYVTKFGGHSGHMAEVILERAGGEAHAEILADVLVGGSLKADDDLVLVHGSPANVEVLRFDDDRVMLSCPEGDATLRVDAEEAEDVFLCPKHSVAMERHAQIHRRHRVKVIQSEK